MPPHISKSLLAQMGGELSTMIHTVEKRLRQHFPFACLEAAETYIFHFGPIFGVRGIDKRSEHLRRILTYRERVGVGESVHLRPAKPREIRYCSREEKFDGNDVSQESFHVGSVCDREGNVEGCGV